jgi:lipopolysaccharide transport system ATP-binding protein
MSSEKSNQRRTGPEAPTALAVRVERLSKWYKLYEQRKHRLIESVNIFSKKRYHSKYYALRDVSFEVRKGETIGIIGPNGSGKSTLLGIISGIIHPGAGVVEVNGSVASLLELGAGFNPELTGMENIRFGGNMRGLSDHELSEKSDAIVRFADIGEYINQPVKTYSSGMFVRLAFALNIHLEPDILIIDEAMAVGDYNFQAKCMAAIRMFMRKGTTILLVSHDMSTVRSLCSRVAYIKEGRLVEIGDPKDVTLRYLAESIPNRLATLPLNEPRKPDEATEALSGGEEPEHVDGGEDFGHRHANMGFIESEDFEKQASAFRQGSGGGRITFMELHDMQGDPIRHIQFGQEVVFHIHFKTFCERFATVCLSLLDHNHNHLIHANFSHRNVASIRIVEGGRYIVSYRMRLPLGDGIYSCEAQIWTAVPGEASTAEKLDSVTSALTFQMFSDETMRIWAKFHVDYDVEVREMAE